MLLAFAAYLLAVLVMLVAFTLHPEEISLVPVIVFMIAVFLSISRGWKVWKKFRGTV